MVNPLHELKNFGQSIWLDYISQAMLKNGELTNLIKNDALVGVTSNPSIFEKAIAKTNDYDDAIHRQSKNNPKGITERLVIRDIQAACDLLRPVYEESKTVDGYACLEVSPHLALDTAGTIEEGYRLWHEVDRPNLMIKVPGTNEGTGAIKMLIADGINVNVTLLFSVAAYKNAALAYLEGLSLRREKGLPINTIHSVASFFISRIDTKIDGMLRSIIENSDDREKIARAKSLEGKIAIANAQLAYATYKGIYQSDIAAHLIETGAHPQRLLWASTSTKDKRYSDVLYVEQLIGENTVNTLPLETFYAFRDHGKVAKTLRDDSVDANEKFARLSSLGVDFNDACDELLSEGIQVFVASFDQLIDAVDKKRGTIAK